MSDWYENEISISTAQNEGKTASIRKAHAKILVSWEGTRRRGDGGVASYPFRLLASLTAMGGRARRRMVFLHIYVSENRAVVFLQGWASARRVSWVWLTFILAVPPPGGFCLGK